LLKSWPKFLVENYGETVISSKFKKKTFFRFSASVSSIVDNQHLTMSEKEWCDPSGEAQTQLICKEIGKEFAKDKVSG
jgi:hypothetical protein